MLRADRIQKKKLLFNLLSFFFFSKPAKRDEEGAANKHAPSARLRVIVNKNVHDTYPRSAVLQKICEICEICGPAGLRPVSFLSVRLMNI